MFKLFKLLEILMPDSEFNSTVSKIFVMVVPPSLELMSIFFLKLNCIDYKVHTNHICPFKLKSTISLNANTQCVMKQ